MLSASCVLSGFFDALASTMFMPICFISHYLGHHQVMRFGPWRSSDKSVIFRLCHSIFKGTTNLIEISGTFGVNAQANALPRFAIWSVFLNIQDCLPVRLPRHIHGLLSIFLVARGGRQVIPMFACLSHRHCTSCSHGVFPLYWHLCHKRWEGLHFSQKAGDISLNENF